MIEKIKYKNDLIAMIIRSKKYKQKKGINFFTKEREPIQVAYMSHKKDHKIQPHSHVKKIRIIKTVPEVLIILEGILRVDFYNSQKKIFKKRNLSKNDIIILLKGAHGFAVKKNCKFIEVKQGPFFGLKDKKKF